MEDEQIVTLYWDRDETAIQETQTKYDRYLTKIACNILADMEDSRESVNDTYLAAWNSIPPQRPSVLSAYLAKLTRRISIDRFRYRTRDKRRDSQYALSLSELDDCVSGGNTTEEIINVKLLADTIGIYLRLQSEEARNAFNRAVLFPRLSERGRGLLRHVGKQMQEPALPHPGRAEGILGKGGL